MDAVRELELCDDMAALLGGAGAPEPICAEGRLALAGMVGELREHCGEVHHYRECLEEHVNELKGELQSNNHQMERLTLDAQEAIDSYKQEAEKLCDDMIVPTAPTVPLMSLVSPVSTSPLVSLMSLVSTVPPLSSAAHPHSHSYSHACPLL